MKHEKNSPDSRWMVALGICGSSERRRQTRQKEAIHSLLGSLHSLQMSSWILSQVNEPKNFIFDSKKESV